MKKFSSVALSVVLGCSLLHGATIATVNGKKIDYSEVAAFFAPLLRGQDFKSLTSDQQKALTQQYIMQDLILQDAKKQNLEKDPLFIKELAQAKDRLLVNVYQDKMLNNIKISNDALKSYYDQNKKNFVVPARVQARHILVTTEKEAKDIINQLKNLKGKALSDKFAQLAQDKSIDQGSKAQGGELGWFDESAMVKPFTDAAFSLKNGEISKTPVKTNFGFHVILKENSQPSKTLAFSDVKQGIENELKLQELQKQINQKGQDLLNSAKVEYK